MSTRNRPWGSPAALASPRWTFIKAVLIATLRVAGLMGTLCVCFPGFPGRKRRSSALGKLTDVLVLTSRPPERTIAIAFALATAHQACVLFSCGYAHLCGIDQRTLDPPFVANANQYTWIPMEFDLLHFVNVLWYGRVVFFSLGWPEPWLPLLVLLLSLPWVATLGHPLYLTDAGLLSARWLGRRVVPTWA
jgi:hypothetical protein